MIVDMHTHVFPPQLARRALDVISSQSGAFAPVSDGTLEGLRDGMARAGVDLSMIAPIATKPSQQAAVNAFAAVSAAPDIIAFGSVHPDAPDAVEELDRIVTLGLRGVKLHPEYQGFAVDDPRYVPLYRAIARRRLPVLFHAGRDIAFAAPCGGSPRAIAGIMPYLEGTVVIAAHMGGYMMAGEALAYLAETGAYIDTSMSYGRLPVPDARSLIEAFGPDRVLFGSDSPWSPPTDELRYIRSLGIGGEELAMILGGNALRIFGRGSGSPGCPF